MQGLEASQLAAQGRRGLASFRRGGHEFAVRRAGVKSGGGRGRYFRYVIKHLETGTVFKLTDEARSEDQTPNVLAELGSSFLMASGGIGSAWAEVKNILEALGGYVLWDKLARVDMCADFPGLNMAVLHDLIVNQDLAITYAQNRASYRQCSRETGLSIGTGAISLRIYDKAYEVRVKKPDAVKRTLLEQLRWGGPQEFAVRVEFQLRRELLVTALAGDLSSYARRRGDLAGYLTSDWFRIADSAPDRQNNNTQRAAVHPLWQDVQAAFAAWAGQPVEKIRRERLRADKDPIRLFKQGLGCLVSVCAELDDAPPASAGELLAKINELVAWGIGRCDEVELLRLYEQKRLERGSRGH